MESIVLIVHVILAITLVGLVLIQQGKGADAGASFGGGGASQTVFGSHGAGSFLAKLTAYIAIGLFISSFTLAYFAKRQSETFGKIDIPVLEETLPVEETDVPAIELESLDVPSVNEEINEVPVN